ncbi:tRNA pseudouridine32 synthase/23S rRNA pseudouridine746 synthase [Streptomyces sp. V4I23]|uniref:pseudouridine synthase n=1 Tax=Streptomyces sp. V4I23 TaxID=3042282 RepID=UPI002787FCFD|nr:pseudouridine synthase [Streptomyces sp. V4I23]MDQ1011744.1 tRNA pseudouridine32 synthase/23S rRNA pseudouridine746 synthase [Streptomyces sp. V4I23]
MRRRNRAPRSPLPQRDGIDPVRLRLPADPDGLWATVRDHLVERYANAIGTEQVDAMLDEGRIVSADGPVTAGEPYEAGRYLFFHRDFAAEERVPFEVGIVHRDERLVIADKPHFLATVPRGSHITETALARLRRDLGLPELQPAHRLDRLTAGLVLFVVRPGDRGAYQTLFRDRRVRKEYEAIAPYDPSVALPRTVRSRIEKERGVIAARETPGEPNSESRIELLEARGALGRYRLLPATGRTHQLRVHMNALGLPILYDPVYPEVREPGPEDCTQPLQLLARALEFTDPVTGEACRFESRLRLAAW